MTALERREEIMHIMVERRKETIANLALEFGVSVRTIRYDIEILSRSYPLYTVQGSGGGVYVSEDYHPYRITISRRDAEILERLKEKADEEEREVIDRLLRKHSVQVLG